MGLTFYYLSGSPFSWKVWLSLEHKRLPYRMVVLDRDSGELDAPEFRKMSPRGLAPVLTDGAHVLYESTVIIEYLEDMHPGRGQALWPRNKKRRSLARLRMAEIESLLFPPVRAMVEEIFLKSNHPSDEERIRKARGNAAAALEYVSGHIAGRFVMGRFPTAPDYMLYPLTEMIFRLNAKRKDIELAPLLPANVMDWRKEVEALPYFDKTYPPHWREA